MGKSAKKNRSAAPSGWRRWRIPLAAAVGVAAIAAAALFLTGRGRWAKAEPEFAQVTVGGGTFVVEVARDEATQKKGLSGRPALADDGGMLFVYPETAPRSFWMANTFVPLTLAYLSADGVIQELHDLTPELRSPVRSKLPARYVLELPRGAFARAGARAGDRIGGLPVPAAAVRAHGEMRMNN